MVAIVYYQEADVIAIISILISMLSVSSKSLIFSRSIDPLTFVWNWLCCVTDFFVKSLYHQYKTYINKISCPSTMNKGYFLYNLMGIL